MEWATAATTSTHKSCKVIDSQCRYSFANIKNFFVEEIENQVIVCHTLFTKFQSGKEFVWNYRQQRTLPKSFQNPLWLWDPDFESEPSVKSHLRKLVQQSLKSFRTDFECQWNARVNSCCFILDGCISCKDYVPSRQPERFSSTEGHFFSP